MEKSNTPPKHESRNSLRREGPRNNNSISPNKQNASTLQKRSPSFGFYKNVNAPIENKLGTLKMRLNNAGLGDFSKLKNDLKLLTEKYNLLKVELDEEKSKSKKLNQERENTQNRMELSFRNQPDIHITELIIQSLENKILDLQEINAVIENSLIERNRKIESLLKYIMDQEEIRNKSSFTILTISTEIERLHQIIVSLKGYLQQNQEKETILQQKLKDNEIKLSQFEVNFAILNQLSQTQENEIKSFKKISIDSGLQEKLLQELNKSQFYQKALIEKKNEHEEQINEMKQSFQNSENLYKTLCDKEMEISNLRDELTQLKQINNEKEGLLESIERLSLEKKELSYNLNENEENTKSIINSLDMLKEEIINLKTILSQNENEIKDLKNANKRTLIELSELEQYKYQNQKLLLEIQEISDAPFF